MNKISSEAATLMRQDSKIGILATIGEDGCPHLSFISSIQGLGEDQITFGRFCDGLSKTFIEQRPDARFLVLTADMRWLRGAARYTHTENTGAVFDDYNNKPLFRYNTYFGFSRVYFMDLLGIGDIAKLPMPAVVCSALLTRAKALTCGKNEKHALSHIGKALFAKLDGLKFLCWQTDDGLSDVVPIIQAAPAGSDRIVFTGFPFGEDLRKAPIGAAAAILCLNLDMQSVLVKGKLTSKGVLDVERVYNSMPPKNQYIYPMAERPAAITDF